ncbi:sarcosine oxidase subunit gamma family protein [Aquabacter sp. CN5-332]|uniref:sarcosine oxidase subunit gamma n=1 Tax=Aquabacter sp. CN5-332 TaxID=3156608 RepID=UPI0032B5998F
MSEILSDHPVTDLVPDGRYGRPDGEPGVIARVVENLALVTVAARKGVTASVVQAAQDAFGFPLTDAPKVSFNPDLAFIGTAPGRWLAATHRAPDALISRLNTAFGDRAALTDQSDANLVLDVYGPRVGEALTKLVPVDIHPSVFAPGDAAATTVALIPLLFWQLNDSPAYRFAVPRSFAPAFLRALTASAAEFGFEITGTGRG